MKLQHLAVIVLGLGFTPAFAANLYCYESDSGLARVELQSSETSHAGQFLNYRTAIEGVSIEGAFKVEREVSLAGGDSTALIGTFIDKNASTGEKCQGTMSLTFCCGAMATFSWKVENAVEGSTCNWIGLESELKLTGKDCD